MLARLHHACMPSLVPAQQNCCDHSMAEPRSQHIPSPNLTPLQPPQVP